MNYPSKLILVASMNPCPCGYYNNPKIECKYISYWIREFHLYNTMTTLLSHSFNHLTILQNRKI
ncbi:ATP-binding protein [Wukongibacter baidiensis]